MNGILLAGALFGALAAAVAANPHKVQFASIDDRGSMTHEEHVNPTTGEIEETDVIAFID
jgi:hypothetical protein